MGIDAEMFVKRRGQPLNNAGLLDASYWLCSTLGADHFFITDTDSYSRAHHALSFVPVWEQDGPDIVPEAGEQFIRVHLRSRYYGPDYERGDWMLLRTTIEWLKRRWPDCEVWYGGDSSGVCAEHMTPARIAEFDELFFSQGREAYTHSPGWRAFADATVVCPTCNHETSNTGGGGGQSFHYCHGCGAKFVAAGRAVYMSRKPEHRNAFALSHDVRAGRVQPSFMLEAQDVGRRV
jgi:hypothetical protein